MLHRNCLLQHVTERQIKIRIKVAGRRRKRRKQLLGDLEEKKLCWKLNEEELELTLL
jgi:hypothetical protein